MTTLASACAGERVRGRRVAGMHLVREGAFNLVILGTPPYPGAGEIDPDTRYVAGSFPLGEADLLPSFAAGEGYFRCVRVTASSDAPPVDPGVYLEYRSGASAPLAGDPQNGSARRTRARRLGGRTSRVVGVGVSDFYREAAT